MGLYVPGIVCLRDGFQRGVWRTILRGQAVLLAATALTLSAPNRAFAEHSPASLKSAAVKSASIEAANAAEESVRSHPQRLGKNFPGTPVVPLITRAYTENQRYGRWATMLTVSIPTRRRRRKATRSTATTSGYA